MTKIQIGTRCGSCQQVNGFHFNWCKKKNK